MVWISHMTCSTKLYTVLTYGAFSLTPVHYL